MTDNISMVPSPLIKFLKRIDLLIAALLLGSAVAPVSSAYLCAESSCKSAPDMILFYGLWLVTTLITAVLLWRIRGWPVRTFVLMASLYATYVVPIRIERHGRWRIQLVSRECLVRAGAMEDEIRRKCGIPSYVCRGPKNIDSDLWNPFSLTVCGFIGDVYENRIVMYNCGGRVATVRGFDAGALGDSQPRQCVTREQVSDKH